MRGTALRLGRFLDSLKRSAQVHRTWSTESEGAGGFLPLCCLLWLCPRALAATRWRDDFHAIFWSEPVSLISATTPERPRALERQGSVSGRGGMTREGLIARGTEVRLPPSRRRVNLLKPCSVPWLFQTETSRERRVGQWAILGSVSASCAMSVLRQLSLLWLYLVCHEWTPRKAFQPLKIIFEGLRFFLTMLHSTRHRHKRRPTLSPLLDVETGLQTLCHLLKTWQIWLTEWPNHRMGRSQFGGCSGWWKTSVGRHFFHLLAEGSRVKPKRAVTWRSHQGMH